MKCVNQKKNEKFMKKKVSTPLKTGDTSVIIATTSVSETLSKTDFGLLVIPISAGIACGLGLTYNVFFETSVKIIDKDTN